MSTLFILSLAVVCAVLGVCLGLVVAAVLGRDPLGLVDWEG